MFMLSQIFAVGVRVLQQLIHDRRFVILSLLAPLLVIYMLDTFFEAVDRPFFDARAFIVPVGAFLIHFITYLLCAVVLVRERTTETLARMLVNGYRRGTIIGGYIMAYSILATVQSLIVLLALRGFFELEYDLQTMLSIYAVMWLLAIISIAMGILVSNFARNEGQIFPFIPLIILPSVFFSGMIVPVDLLPDWASWFSWTTPLYYASEALHAFTGEGGNSGLIAALPVYGIIVLTLATFTLREQE
jgi:ABC-2 type transport system permease protein